MRLIAAAVIALVVTIVALSALVETASAQTQSSGASAASSGTVSGCATPIDCSAYSGCQRAQCEAQRGYQQAQCQVQGLVSTQPLSSYGNLGSCISNLFHIGLGFSIFGFDPMQVLQSMACQAIQSEWSIAQQQLGSFASTIMWPGGAIGLPGGGMVGYPGFGGGVTTGGGGISISTPWGGTNVPVSAPGPVSSAPVAPPGSGTMSPPFWGGPRNTTVQPPATGWRSWLRIPGLF